MNGMLYIGRKMDGSFISREEIELARAAAERLLDISLSAELSSRLIKLQQMRFSEQSIIDQRPRRVLHDEVLPALHTAMLQISAGGNSERSALQLLSDTHRMISNLLKELPSAYSPQFDRIGLTYSLQQLASVEFPNAFTGIDWKWTEEDAKAVNELPVLKKEVLYYAAREAIRNAASHAVPPPVSMVSNWQLRSRFKTKCRSPSRIMVLEWLQTKMIQLEPGRDWLFTAP